MDRWAVVDVETTGTSVTSDRIIDIGIILMEQGRVVHTFSSLIDPDCYLPPEITFFTGIHPHQLETAPTFRSLSDHIFDLLDGCLFVAHNARFDYAFLKHEFRRVGLDFSAKQLCTVKLARRLFPSLAHYNLDSLIDHCGLSCAQRHRALPDAQAVCDFLKHVSSLPAVDQAIADISRSPALPPHLPPGLLAHLPHRPGVYIFSSADGTPLYVGKARDIKSRCTSHFQTNYTATSELLLTHRVHSIDYSLTAGDFGAQLLEIQQISALHPLYNRRLRGQPTHFLRATQSGNYSSLVLNSDIAYANADSILGCFRSARQAKNHLAGLVKKFQLCPHLLGPTRLTGACFNYSLGLCRGACIGEENPALYNARFVQAFSTTRLASWPFSGPIAITETDNRYDCTTKLVFNNWQLVDTKNTQTKFDWHIYKLLYKYIYRDKGKFDKL